MMDINFIDDDYKEESADAIYQWTQTVGKEFETSQQFQTLSRDEQEFCFFLLDFFFESAYGYGLVGPGHLDNEVIDELMLDIMPRKISADLKTFQAFEAVMEQFLVWCEEKNYMGETVSIRQHIHELAPEMVARSQNPTYWGMAKSIMMGDPSHFNVDNGYHQPIRRDSPKIGRNELCLCGSGKKYKKCCLVS